MCRCDHCVLQLAVPLSLAELRCWALRLLAGEKWACDTVCPRSSCLPLLRLLVLMVCHTLALPLLPVQPMSYPVFDDKGAGACIRCSLSSSDQGRNPSPDIGQSSTSSLLEFGLISGVCSSTRGCEPLFEDAAAGLELPVLAGLRPHGASTPGGPARGV